MIQDFSEETIEALLALGEADALEAIKNPKNIEQVLSGLPKRSRF
jgi:hypothetical protein